MSMRMRNMQRQELRIQQMPIQEHAKAGIANTANAEHAKAGTANTENADTGTAKTGLAEQLLQARRFQINSCC